MRPYATVSPLFWTGSTGKKLRKLPDIQRVAIYLMTSPHSHQSGIYYQPVMYICNEVGLPEKGARKALAWLSEERFCEYDEKSEWIWVREMAEWQVGSSLSENDNRCKGLQRYLTTLPSLPFLTKFISRYASAFHINEGLISPFKGSESPSEGFHSYQEQEQEQEQEGSRRGLNGHSSATPTDVSIVFNRWKEVHSHHKAQLDDKRIKLIRVALKSYSPEQLCQSIEGYKNSPYHMGQNDKKTIYDDIELFLRDAKHIDAGMKFAEQGAPTQWQ